MHKYYPGTAVLLVVAKFKKRCEALRVLLLNLVVLLLISRSAGSNHFFRILKVLFLKKKKYGHF